MISNNFNREQQMMNTNLPQEFLDRVGIDRYDSANRAFKLICEAWMKKMGTLPNASAGIKLCIKVGSGTYSEEGIPYFVATLDIALRKENPGLSDDLFAQANNFLKSSTKKVMTKGECFYDVAVKYFPVIAPDW